MKKLFHCLACAALALCLTQCVGPDGRPMSPFGPLPPRPYSDQREQYRADVSDYSQGENAQAYERGGEDGRADYSAGEQKSYLRHYRNFTDATRAAYQDGYDHGYTGGPPPNNNNGGATANDPAYNQGYDYGLRDRVGGRPSDPGAYSGSYDPRYRRSFERGYGDAYDSGRGR